MVEGQEAQQAIRPIRLETSIVAQAKDGDVNAIEHIFRQFCSDDEVMELAYYFGTMGLFGLGRSSFGGLTNRRIISINIGMFGEVTCRDAFLENVTSGVVYQPSKALLYLAYFFIGLFSLWIAVFPAGSGLAAGSPMFTLLFPLLAGLFFLASIHIATILYYSLKKCGLVYVIQERYTVYMFCNRNAMGKANRLYKTTGVSRDARLRLVGRQ